MSQPGPGLKRFTEYKFKAREALLGVLRSKGKKEAPASNPRRHNLFIAALSAFIVSLFIRAFFIQVFYIPTNSMERSLSAGDRVIANKLLYGLTNPFWGANGSENLLYILPNPFYKSNMPLSRKKYIVRFRQKPGRMDIVIFKAPSMPGDVAKRIIGLPGEQVWMKKGIIYINGKQIRERDGVIKDRSDLGPVIVPENSYFVLGDNRATSSDSRHWGAIHRDSIIGSLTARIWPPTKFRIF